MKEYPPDTNEINRYFAAKRLLEPFHETEVVWAVGGIELICKRNLFGVVF